MFPPLVMMKVEAGMCFVLKPLTKKTLNKNEKKTLKKSMFWAGCFCLILGVLQGSDLNRVYNHENYFNEDTHKDWNVKPWGIFDEH